ncbi:putative pentatricopeptide repeat-containing protein At3g47840 [Wolffia australiana]
MVAAPPLTRLLLHRTSPSLHSLYNSISFPKTTHKPYPSPLSPTSSSSSLSPSPFSSSSTFEWNTHLRELVKLRRLSEARALFDQIPHPDAVSWTTLLSGYVASNNSLAAVKLFSLFLLSSPLRVDSFLLSLALKACGQGKLLGHGRTLHAFAEKSGLTASSVFSATALVDMYSKLGLLPSALQLFDEMPVRNLVSWTSIITALVHGGRFEQALCVFSRMSGVGFDSHTLAIALTACGGAGFLVSGKEIHGCAIKSGLAAVSFVTNAIASMYWKCHKLELGVAVFALMPNPDVVSWSSLVAAYLNQGQAGAAIETFGAMARAGDVPPNEYTFSAAISACTGLGYLAAGEQLHARALHAGLASSASVSNAMITLYSSSGKMGEAEFVFQEMGCRDFVTWSAMICAQAQMGRIEQSFGLLRAMARTGDRPNEVAIGSLLSGCGAMAMLSQGRQLHAHAILAGLNRTAMARSSLVAMYSRCGSLPEARLVFEEIPRPELDHISWTAMISGYAEHGGGRNAIELFEEMLASGLAPDGVAFLSVLSACCHEGLLQLGLRYFISMEGQYGVEPKKEHYGCMVDLLCRAGALEMAEAVAGSLPPGVEDDGVVWAMVLRACRSGGQAEKGRQAAEKVLVAQPRCAGTHVELCNMYAAEGRWREAAAVRKTMREKGVRKETGSSWITVSGDVAVFAAADRRHGETEKIYATLDALVQWARQAEEEEGDWVGM